MTSLISNIDFHVRSSSFPKPSHPTILKVEAQLNKIQISATPCADEICNNLSSLMDLYKSMDALINLNETRKSNELLDGSVKILDICGSIKNLVSQIKENVRDVQSALRRRSSSMESSITKYKLFQKKTRKDAKRLILSLKQMQIKTATSSVLQISAVAISIFRSILVFLSAPIISFAKQSNWSLFSKSNYKNVEVECEEEIEAKIEAIENGLEGVFRGMIKTRVTLLNNVSSSN